jgi:hypothetical protein
MECGERSIVINLTGPIIKNRLAVQGGFFYGFD